MKPLEALDLSGLAQFKASDLLVEEGTPRDGKPMQVALDLIDFDPMQPRRRIDDTSIRELATSIAAHGVLEPVSLRSHPEAAGRYVVNRGERRVRAARQAELADVPAFLDERVDPYAQAVENLHRENMSPFDLASFIAEREREGHTRAEIGRRLNKSRAFVTEAACLINSPPEIKAAFDAGRLGSDARTLYRLALAMRKQPEKAAALLAGEGLITRSQLLVALGEGAPERTGSVESVREVAPPLRTPVLPSAGRTVLVVEHGGRRGSLRLKARDDDTAEIRFGDGTRDVVHLKDLRLVCWAAEEST